MDYSKLEKLGLNRNEAIVYLELAKQGKATAGELIKKTGFHRNIVYDNLEKLVDKGIVSFIVEGKKKLFQIAPPDMISDMIEKQQTALEKQKKIALEVQDELRKVYAVSGKKQEAVMLRGIKGIKVLLNDTLEHGTDYFVFGAPESSLTMMGSAFWKNHNVKRKKKKMIVQMIFNDELREWSKQIRDKLTQIKFLPEHFDSLTETIIYGSNVAIIVWTETPIAILIRDEEAAKGYKQYFQVLWKTAKL